MALLDRAADPNCYLTTTGRRSDDPHEIEIWFATDGRRLHLISGGGDRSDWVRNLLVAPRATVRLNDVSFAVIARLPLPAGPERSEAVRRLHAKYAGQVGGTAEDWERSAYIVALDPAAQTGEGGAARTCTMRPDEGVRFASNTTSW